MRPDAAAAHSPLLGMKPRRRREVRDPYDGLRPWSAITHGLGAVLSVLGTGFLLLRAAARRTRSCAPYFSSTDCP